MCPGAAACGYNFRVPQSPAGRRDLALLLVLIAGLLLAGLGQSALTDRDDKASIRRSIDEGTSQNCGGSWILTPGGR